MEHRGKPFDQVPVPWTYHSGSVNQKNGRADVFYCSSGGGK
jgi:hypothetical protein